MKKILIPEDIAESGKTYLKERGYYLKTGISTDEETLKAELMDADGVIVRNASYKKYVFESSPSLKVIARHGTGTDNIDIKAAEALGIWVVNGPIANINTVAEYTLSQLLALGTGLLNADCHTRSKDWSYRLTFRRHELQGRTLGIIGFGNIGKAVAQKAALGLGMIVLAYDIRNNTSAADGITVCSCLDEVLSQSDYVTLHIPSTSDTKHLFNKEIFRKMKPGSCFINCARGDLYDEEALVEALSCGHLRGAALDVYAEEPLTNSPLLSMHQVILSQHNAGLSEESKEKMSLYAAQGIHQILSGQKPAWPVNHPAMPRQTLISANTSHTMEDSL